MTITTSTNRVVQYGNGATTIWNYSFLIPDATEVVVQITDRTTGVVTTLTTLQYSITGIGNPSGGTVTYSPALTTNQSITITRILPVTQTVSLSNQGAFYPTVVEGSLDYLTMVAQQLADSITRALQISPNGVNTIDAGNNRIINVAAPVATTDAARIADVQAAQATANAVPTPVLADVGKWLKATAVGSYAWTTISVLSSQISDATAAGIALLTGANAAAQRTSLGLGSLATLSTVTATEVAANTLTFAKFARSGNVGQVWASGGAGADAAYVGGYTLIDSQTKSGVATVDITLPAGYKYFKLFVREVIPASGGSDLYLRISQNSGGSYATTGYDYGQNFTNATSGTTGFYSGSSITTTAYLLMQIPQASNGFNFSEITVFPGNASRVPKILSNTNWITTGSALLSATGGGQSGSAVGAATNLRLLMSSGNISLAYELYGVA